MATKFSVLLSVYAKDDPTWLDTALHSVWTKQLLRPDQIVIVKDGEVSADLARIISSWDDRLADVVVVVCLGQNLGLGTALDEGLKHCKHDVVARMDADDEALPDRFQTQIRYIEDNPSVDVVGSFITEFDTQGVNGRVRKVPVTHEDIMHSLWICPFIHPSVVFRKGRVLSVGGYDRELRRRQDYELWFRCALGGCRFANIPRSLLLYRFSDGTHQKQSAGLTWQQAVIGYRGSKRVGLAVWKQLACFFPFFRSLLPGSLQHWVYRASYRIMKYKQ